MQLLLFLRKPRIWTALLAVAISVSAASSEGAGVLERFYRENDGKALRRLPGWVLPEALFCSLRNVDIDGEGTNVLGRIYALCRDRLDVNVLTWQPRCRLDLSSPRVEERVAEAVRSLGGSGISLVLFVDPRLMRNEFFSRWPDDCLHWRQFEVVKPDADGTARFCAKMERLGDHMLYGTKDKYSWWKPGGLVSVRAMKGRDSATARIIEAEDVSCTEKAVSGTVRGLASDEELVVEVDFPLNEIDPCSPHLLPFMHEMALRYRKLGIDGYCLDEWGFQSPKAAMLQHRAFWHSVNFALAYSKRSGGRNLEKDMVEFALHTDTPAIRAAVNAYVRTIYDTCVAIEGDMYATNKRLFGADAFVGKHPTWWAQLGSAMEPLHNGLNWWAARRDWAQSDENVPVPADTGMMKKLGSPLWLNEGYGNNPRHYVSTLWRYALCGGRMNWHGIVGDRRTDYLRRTCKNDIERRYRRIADMFPDETIRAEEILRLLPLMTRAPIDCPVAHIFGHDRFVNWLDPACGDWGRRLAHGLGQAGYYVDAYPANEIFAGTFAVDSDGFLRVGRQCYKAVTLCNLSAGERAAWERIAAAEKLNTRVFSNPRIDEVAAYLESVDAVRQTPLWENGIWGGTDNLLPESDGVMFLTDGTAVRIKGCCPNFAGDEIEGELKTDGVCVKYKARGMFAARAENGALTGIAGGEVAYVDAPGFSLALSSPTDIVLVKLSDGWHGVWQTPSMDEQIPDALRRLVAKWVKLRGIATALRRK